MKVIPFVVHKCLNFPFDNEVFTIHHNGFNPLSSTGKFSLDSFWPEPMEPIKPQEDLFFISYQKFKEKKIVELSLWNMSPSTSEPTILDEIMLEPKQAPNNQDQPKIETSPSSYKWPRDSETNPIVPPRINQIYKVKEKVVEQPPMVPSIPPLREENKPMVDQPTPT